MPLQPRLRSSPPSRSAPPPPSKGCRPRCGRASASSGSSSARCCASRAGTRPAGHRGAGAPRRDLLARERSVDLGPLAAQIEALDPDTLFDVVRAFHIYFHLINLAEQQQRLRSLREREAAIRCAAPRVHRRRVRRAARGRGPGRHHAGAVAAHRSAAGVHRAPDRGAPPHRAGPPAPHRRAGPGARGAPAALGRAARAGGGTRGRITLLWQTEEARPRRPTVLDEVGRPARYVGPSSSRWRRRCTPSWRRALAAATPSAAREGRRACASHLGRRRPRRQPERHPGRHPPDDRRHATVVLTATCGRVEQLRPRLSVASERGRCSRELATSLAARRRRPARGRAPLRAAGPIEPYRAEARAHRRALRRTLAPRWDQPAAYATPATS